MFGLLKQPWPFRKLPLPVREGSARRSGWLKGWEAQQSEFLEVCERVWHKFLDVLLQEVITIYLWAVNLLSRHLWNYLACCFDFESLFLIIHYNFYYLLTMNLQCCPRTIKNTSWYTPSSQLAVIETKITTVPRCLTKMWEKYCWTSSVCEDNEVRLYVSLE